MSEATVTIAMAESGLLYALLDGNPIAGFTGVDITSRPGGLDFVGTEVVIRLMGSAVTFKGKSEVGDGDLTSEGAASGAWLKAKGTAMIDIAVEVLPHALVMFPSTYRVVGSVTSNIPDTVRLIVESDELDGHDLLMTCEIRDVGNTRTVVMAPTADR